MNSVVAAPAKCAGSGEGRLPPPVPPGGLTDPVHDAQAAFRAALDALARPGSTQTVGTPIAGLALGPAMAHLLLALTDESTPVWWQQGGATLDPWLCFHTGARAAARPEQAAFAVITDAATVPDLASFALGCAASPEFSTTLLVEVPSLDQGGALHWHGPGIAGSRLARLAGLPPAFWSQWQANHALFPQGVDVLFTFGVHVVGLPRTTRISRLEGI